MKKTSLLILLNLSILSFLCSQSSQKQVFGAVINEQGYPVSYAMIAIQTGQTIVHGTVTDKDGLFELYMNEADELNISHVSYENTTRTFDELVEYPIVEVKTTKHSFAPIVVVSEGKWSKIGNIRCCSCVPFRKDTPPIIPVSIGLQNSKWTFYPNPVQDELHITPLMKEGFISLFSATGVRLKRTAITDERTISIHVQQLPDGIYFLRYEHQGWQEWIGKVVKTGTN